MSEQPSIRDDFFHLIDGELVGSDTALEVINPANETVFARAPSASRSQLDRTTSAARRAFESWSRTSYEERAALLRRLGETLRAHQ
jgi:aldehyde dehydrogenase (NAD+)